MIDNKCIIRTYEENTMAGIPSQIKSINIESHWNRNELVEIIINDKRAIVLGEELKKAIDNCMNV
jgi:hypothetical protein